MSELPEGWKVIKLTEGCELNPPKPKPNQIVSNLPVTFVPMAAVDAESGAITNPSIREYSTVAKGFTSFQDGDVIMAKITPCMENGKAAIARRLSNGFGFGSTEFHVFRSSGVVLPEYIFHFIRQESFRKLAEANMTGSVGQKRVPASFLNDCDFPLPPLAEQRRIVAKLETLLGKVEACQQRLAKIPVILKRFRQAVLAAACSGELTVDWRRENIVSQTAEEFVIHVQLLASQNYQAEVLQSKKNKLKKPKALHHDNFVPLVEVDAELPNGWCITRIGDISECLDYKRVPINNAERKNRVGEIPYYGANGQVGWIDDYLFDDDLVLVVEDETFIGREKPFSYVIKGKSWVNNHAHVLKPVNGISTDYLNICLSFYNFTPLTSGTTGRRKLTQDALVNAKLLIAPLLEQQEIVRRVEALFQLADQLEARYQRAQAQVDKLQQSILAKAFRGELVPTEAELARREGRDYEPAAALLERLRQTRNGLASATTPKSRHPKSPASNGLLFD